MTTPSLPRVNTLLQLELKGFRGPLASRVEDGDHSTVTIAAPDWPGIEPVGVAVTLHWSSDLGQCAARGVVTRVMSRPIEMWVVRIEGAPRVVRARSDERVSLQLDVTVDVVDRTVPVRFTAETVDVARGGLRLVTRDWVLLEHGDELRLRLGRDQPPAIAAGTVLNPLRTREVLEFAVQLRQPVPERAGLLLRRLARQAEEDQRISEGWRR